MPERVGFEPMIEFPLNTLSKRTSSIARLKRRSKRVLTNYIKHSIKVR